MKSGRAIRKVLESVDTVDGLALVACSARWRETDIDLTLRITNVGPIAWSRLQTSICLQRPAAPDYLDEEDTRTYLVSDEGFVASAELVFPSRRRLVYAWVGEELPMKKRARRRLAAPALFVVSRDERYVLGYAWQQARRLFLNRAGCVPFRASAPAPATGYRIRERGDARRCVPALLRVERHERPADMGEEAQHSRPGVEAGAGGGGRGDEGRKYRSRRRAPRKGPAAP